MPELKLASDGTWLIDGQEITHEKTLKVLFRSMEKRPEGWVVKIGREVQRVTVEDTPYFVVRVSGSPQDGFVLFLSDGTDEPLDPKTLIYSERRLVARVKNGTEVARFLSGPYWDILKNIEEDDQGTFLILNGRRVSVSKTKLS